MAITTSGIYWLNLEKALRIDTNLVDWGGGALKYALDVEADTPNFDTDEFRSQINEVAGGNGYTAGGNTITYPATDGFSISANLNWDISDPQWTSSTITADAGVICSGNATNTADETYILQDFGTQVSTSNGTLDVAINASGVVTFS